MPKLHEVSAVVVAVERPELAAIFLRKFGCDLRVEKIGDLTVFISREKSPTPVNAISNFMQRLECAQIRFEYICLGNAEKALYGYYEALERLDRAVCSAA
jgi:hypothetical protein